MKFKSLSKYFIKGRGTVFSIENPWNVNDEELLKNLTNKTVEIDGSKYKIKGVERFLTLDHYKGEKIGLLVEEV